VKKGGCFLLIDEKLSIYVDLIIKTQISLFSHFSLLTSCNQESRVFLRLRLSI
jgi:hypothetical protein